jgi:hypothetical protein
MVTWYKVLDKDLKAKDGGNFDYSKFVESKEFTPEIKDCKSCNSGYHITKYWNMFLTDKSNRIFEVEVKGLVEEEVLAGVCEKAVCSSLKIIKEFIPVYKNELNTGYSNTGYRNTGDSNTGDSNTGDSNTGNRNTGNRNTGDSNTGDWNTANKHVGSFNSKSPEKVYLFNKEILFTEYEKINFPNWLFFDLEKDYKNSFKKAFVSASVEEIKATIALPNFDYKVFQEISGVTKTMFNKRLGKSKVSGR